MRPQILMLSGTPPRTALLAHFLERFAAVGADVWLAAMADVERTHGDLGLAGLRSLRTHLAVTTPEFYRLADRVTPVEETWLHVSRDRWVRDRADRADVLIATDMTAIYSVWQLARDNPHPAAVFGLEPGAIAAEQLVSGFSPAELRRRLGDLARVQRRRAKQVVRTTVETGAASRAGRALAPLADWRQAAVPVVAVPRIVGLEERGQLHQAAAFTTRVLSRTRSNRRRANILGAVALRHIADGTAAPQLREAVEAELAYADQLYERGDAESAAASFWQATRLAFHRGFHLDTTRSPLADDPSGFTEPFRRSVVSQVLSRPRGRLTPAQLPDPPATRRVLLATLGNTNFLGDISARLEGRDDIEVRSVVPKDLGSAIRLTRDPRRLITSLLAENGRAERFAEEGLREHLDWADVVFVDWCTHLPRVFQLVDPGTSRLVLRLHSYEAFTPWPLLLDTSRLDQLIFVSDHVRDLVLAQRPELSELDTPVLINGIDLRRFVRPKSADARFTVAMIGFQAVAKDVLWALETIRRLRAHDQRYRLMLIGGDFQDFLSPAAARYGAEFRRQAERLERQGGLIRTGHLDDVGTALVDAGTILCSSVREGSPVGLVEAASSGCVPVVRDWPFFAGGGRGARSLYPPEWIVEDPGEAADRLARVTADQQTWQSESQRCAAEAIQRWDLSVVAASYDELFGSSEMSRASK